MDEYALNRLTSDQLAELALTSATLLVAISEPTVKLELYYLNRHFVEVTYCLNTFPGQSAQWRLYSANHFPDEPSSTKYLTIYLQQIKLSIN